MLPRNPFTWIIVFSLIGVSYGFIYLAAILATVVDAT